MGEQGEEIRSGRPRHNKVVHVLVFLAGIVLPIVTLGVELGTEMSRQHYVDPIPSLVNVLLIAYVPAANWSLFRSAKHLDYPRVRSVASGMAMGTALLYSLVYLPILPLAAFAVGFMGMGFLPAAPIFSLGAVFFYRAHWNACARKASRPQMPFAYALLGALVALLGPVLLNFSYHQTQYGVALALAENPSKQNRGISYLRDLGDERHLENWVADRPSKILDVLNISRRMLGLGIASNSLEAEAVYYRVTGEGFDWPEPSNRIGESIPIRFGWLDDDFGQPRRRGGSLFTNRTMQERRLRLAASSMSGWVDGAGLHGYMEWTMIIESGAFGQREAVARVQLPSGAVVSRVTLWVEGEEREAAFAGRSETTAAYENIVRVRQDPVLVTTSGPDLVQIRCFPVPPNGEMKLRIGVTFPLIREVGGRSFFKLPEIVESNFVRRNSHQVHLEVKDVDSEFTAVNPPDLVNEAREEGQRLLAGNLRKDQQGNQTRIQLNTPVLGTSWASSRVVNSAYPERILQTLESREIEAPVRVIVVVDGSKGVADRATQIVSGLNNLQSLARLHVGVEIGILLASDGVRSVLPIGVHSETVLSDALEGLLEGPFVGGQENATALGTALAQLRGLENSAVLWIFGSQPKLHSDSALEELLALEPGDPAIFGFPVSDGENDVQEFLHKSGQMNAITYRKGLEQDLQELIGRWLGQPTLTVVRRPLESSETTPDNIHESSDHLVRLWAQDEALRLQQKGETERARSLARDFQLVTGLTGAVVLETKAMYKQAGLQPVDPNSVPSVPEPGFYLLAGIAGLFVLAAWRTRAAS